MKFRKILTRAAILCAGVATLAASPARAGDRYYSLIFGSQSSPQLLRYSHTWATFVRVVGEGTDPNGYQVEAHTISWMPASLDVHTWSSSPERGVNLDLFATLAVVGSHAEGVTVWGPFEMKREVYERSLRVKAILDSGKAEYRAIDTMRNMMISDCIHAVAAIDPVFGRGHYPLIRVGKPASRYIARQIMARSLFDQYQTQAAWLIPRLALDRYAIEVVPPQQMPKRPCVACRLPD